MGIDQDVLVCEVSVERGVDARGHITDDPTAIVEGELRLTYTDGRSEIVDVFRRPEAHSAIVGA